MKVSIITVCFNSKGTIEDTFKSVASQDYKNIEYIVIDGGSSDGTLEILDKYSSIISQHMSEPDKGIYDAMNKGLAMATGDIIGFINSDDMLDSACCISEIVKSFESTKASIVYGDKIYVDPKDTNKLQRYWKAGQFDINSYKWGWMTPHLSTYIKKSVYEELGDYDINFKIASDYELMLRFIVKNGITPVYLPIVIAKMRSGGVSNSSIINIFKSNLEVYKSWKKNDLSISPLIIFIKPLKKIFQFLRK
jgi:glycosyltransferase involved in cell wall biosynthesis